MEWLDRQMEKWNQFVDRVRPFFDAIGRFFRRIGRDLATLWRYLYALRSVILAAPMGAVAVVLAAINMKELPETVEITAISIDPEAADALFGLFTLNTEYITRELAVMAPLVVTMGCLLLMLCSKRTLYPFMIALFSLCLPFVLQFFCTYPM